MGFSNQIRSRLLAARKALHPRVTQAHVAHAVGVHPRTLGSWERGDSAPTWEQLDLWFEFLRLERARLILEPFYTDLGTLRRLPQWGAMEHSLGSPGGTPDSLRVKVYMDGKVVEEGSGKMIVNPTATTEEWRGLISRWFYAFVE